LRLCHSAASWQRFFPAPSLRYMFTIHRNKSLCAVKTIYNFERYGVGTREGSTTIFSLFFEVNYHSSSSWFSFTYDVERTFVVQFHVQWHKIHSIWLTNESFLESVWW
jgi:hypothetical protein